MRTSRTLAASLLTVGALAVLLAGWFGAGWGGVQAERARIMVAANTRAEEIARQLAADLSERLEELRGVEAARPYYHYQSLFHDPRGAAEGSAVAPSPLAAGPDDELVMGHFQIDARGLVSMPTINDELPELSLAEQLEDNRKLRAQLSAAVPQLGGRGDTGAVAVNLPAPVAPPLTTSAPKTNRVASERSGEAGFREEKNPVKPRRKAKPVLEEPQVQALDPEAYSQNVQSNQIYQDSKVGRPPVPQRQAARGAAPSAPPASPRDPVQIVVSPPQWMTARLDDVAQSFLIRRVDTPDGTLRQGLVLDGAAVDEWLGNRARGVAVHFTSSREDGDAVAALPMGAWVVAVHREDFRKLARREAADVGTAFLRRFVPMALVAVVCGVLVIMVVARAERMARQRAQFAAAAAHELRTPLAGLQLYGDMIAEGLGDPAKHRDYARRIADEASRLGRVVSNVLGFSQLERGNLSVRCEAGDLVATVRSAVERARPALDRAGVAVTLVGAGQASAWFDPDAVARILGNLLDNAEKYSRDAKARTVTVEVTQRQRSVEVAVSDRGTGVPARLRRNLFRPFWRGAKADGPAGLGLGLALSRSLAVAMGGDVTYREAEAGGACFVVEVPAKG